MWIGGWAMWPGEITRSVQILSAQDLGGQQLPPFLSVPFGHLSEPVCFLFLAGQYGAVAWSSFLLSEENKFGDLEAHLHVILITQELSKTFSLYV